MRAGIMVQPGSDREYRSFKCEEIMRNGTFKALAGYLREVAEMSADGFASFTAENGVHHTVWVDAECVSEGMEAEIRKGAE